jgi:hypothetical protein
MVQYESTGAAMKSEEPQKEHNWLEKMVGEWNYEFETAMGADQTVKKFTGTEQVRSLGGLWVVGESQGDMGTSVVTIGYDTQKKSFVGTWVGSMMTHLWNYSNGWLNQDETVLTLESDGPAMSSEGKPIEGKMARYRDIVELESPDHRILKSQMQTDDGEWQEFLTMHFRRVS